MKKITIELTNTEYKAFEYVVYSPEEWAKNALHNRARQAIDEISSKVLGPDKTVQISDKEIASIPNIPKVISHAKNLDPEIKKEIVKRATLKTAKQRNEELEAP